MPGILCPDYSNVSSLDREWTSFLFGQAPLVLLALLPLIRKPAPASNRSAALRGWPSLSGSLAQAVTNNVPQPKPDRPQTAIAGLQLGHMKTALRKIGNVYAHAYALLYASMHEFGHAPSDVVSPLKSRKGSCGSCTSAR